MPTIVSGSTSQSLASNLAAETGYELAATTLDRFPDGELIARAPDLDARTVVVVTATVSSDALVELLQLQDAAREGGAREVVTVLPYMGYARQDQAFEPGEPVSARAAARAISPGADRVVVVSPHTDSVLEHFEPPAVAVDGGERLAVAIPGDLESPVFIAPDEGAIELAETVRDAYGRGDTTHFEKTRHSGSEVEIAARDVDARDRDAVVVDDIIATGGTMSESIAAINGAGARRVYAACVHPVLAGNARLKLARAGVHGLIATDSIERPASIVSLAPLLATAV